MTKTEDNLLQVVLKIETDGMGATKVIVLTLLDTSNFSVQSFSDQPGAPSIQEAVNMLPFADSVIVQTTYAVRVLADLYGLHLDPAKVTDVCAISKAVLCNERHHSMDAWAARLGVPRRKFFGANYWSPEAQAHCEYDARLIGAIALHLEEMTTASVDMGVN